MKNKRFKILDSLPTYGPMSKKDEWVKFFVDLEKHIVEGGSYKKLSLNLLSKKNKIHKRKRKPKHFGGNFGHNKFCP